jgi:hypothetical protein
MPPPEEPATTPEEPTIPDEQNPLRGTKWKLAGIVDTKTETLKELEPKDCEDCYTLTFLTDKIATGYGGYVLPGSNRLEKVGLDFSLLGQYAVSDVMRYFENEEFIRSLYSQNTKSYSVSSKELKFINEIDNYYLLFKKISP